MMRLFRWLLTILLQRYYVDIDICPIYYFNRAMETGDRVYMARSKYFKLSKCYEAYEILFDQFISVYGIPDSYERYLNKYKQAAYNWDQAYNHNKPWLKILARKAEHEANMELSFEGESLEVTAARLSKQMGFAIDTKKTTINQFYAYIKMNSNG